MRIANPYLMEDITKKIKKVEDLVADTAGGEMPDPLRRSSEKASEAAEAFKEAKLTDKNNIDKKEDLEKEQVKKAG
jgi:hypothetical protein